MTKLTIEQIQSKIEDAKYLLIDGTTMTICALILTNGMVVIGESNCIDPANFDADIGKANAYQVAEEKIWELEGYLARENAYQDVMVPANEMPDDLPDTSKSNGLLVDLPVVAISPHDEMLAYVGTKIVNAKPMTRGVYNILRGWELPANEDPHDDGFLVEYTDAQRPNQPGFQGYISWSPKDVFEGAYHVMPASDIEPTDEQRASDQAQAVAAAQADMGKVGAVPTGQPASNTGTGGLPVAGIASTGTSSDGT